MVIGGIVLIVTLRIGLFGASPNFCKSYILEITDSFYDH